MAKKKFLVRLCIILLVISAMPFSVQGLEEVTKNIEKKVIQSQRIVIETPSLSKQNIKRQKYRLEYLCTEVKDESRSLKQKGFVHSRFYLSDYLEQDHFFI